jgi:undecaprenyl-diphosphatase
MVGGLWRGLDHEDVARFAFLVATPPILAAGLLKLPSVTGHCGE